MILSEIREILNNSMKNPEKNLEIPKYNGYISEADKDIIHTISDTASEIENGYFIKYSNFSPSGKFKIIIYQNQNTNGYKINFFKESSPNISLKLTKGKINFFWCNNDSVLIIINKIVREKRTNFVVINCEKLEIMKYSLNFEVNFFEISPCLKYIYFEISHFDEIIDETLICNFPNISDGIIIKFPEIYYLEWYGDGFELIYYLEKFDNLEEFEDIVIRIHNIYFTEYKLDDEKISFIYKLTQKKI